MGIMKYVIVFSILFVDYLTVSKLSNYLTICKRNDPNLEECVRKSAEQILQTSSDGMPEFGIPPTNPLLVPRMVIAHGSGPYFLQFDIQDCNIYGLQRMKVSTLRVDLENFHLEGNLTSDRMYFESEYEVKGRVLLLPISGRGQVRTNYTQVSIYMAIDGHKIKRNNKQYYNITKVYVDSRIKGGTIHLDNLFNGDKLLGAAMNQAINENIVELYDFMRPATNEALSEIFGDFAKRIFRKVTVQELFPMADNIES